MEGEMLRLRVNNRLGRVSLMFYYLHLQCLLQHHFCNK